MARSGAAERFRLNFRRLLYQHNRKQGPVATKAGLSNSWATKVMAGDTMPSIEAVDKIAHELGVDVSEFFLDPSDLSRPSDRLHSTPATPLTTGGEHEKTQAIQAAFETVIERAVTSALEKHRRKKSATPQTEGPDGPRGRARPHRRARQGD